MMSYSDGNSDVTDYDHTDVKSGTSMKNAGQITSESLRDDKSKSDSTKDSAFSDLFSTIEDGFFFKKSKSKPCQESSSSIEPDLTTGVKDHADHIPGKYNVKIRKISIPEDDFVPTARHRYVDKLSDQTVPTSSYMDSSPASADMKSDQICSVSSDTSLESMSNQCNEVSMPVPNPGLVSRMSELSKDRTIKESGRGNMDPVSDGNHENANNDLNPDIPSGRPLSRQSSFKEQINTSGSTTKPTLTRSNSKPLSTDNLKFRRNLELWGGRSDVLSSRCESIADLRTTSRSLSRGRNSPIGQNLSSARSTVSLSRAKADVGGLVSKWESGKTKNSTEKSTHSSALNLSLPIRDLRDQIKPKSKSPSPRVVLAKAGYKDVRQKWETKSSANCDDDDIPKTHLTSKSSKVRSSSIGETVPPNMLLHSPKEGITMVTRKTSVSTFSEKICEKKFANLDKNIYSGKSTSVSSKSDLSKMSVTIECVSGDKDKLYMRKTSINKHSSDRSSFEDNPNVKKSDDETRSSGPVVRSVLTSPTKTEPSRSSYEQSCTETFKAESQQDIVGEKDEKSVDYVEPVLSLGMGLGANECSVEGDSSYKKKENVRNNSPEGVNSKDLKVDKNEEEIVCQESESKTSKPQPPKVLPKTKSRLLKTESQFETNVDSTFDSHGQDSVSILYNKQVQIDKSVSNRDRTFNNVSKIQKKDNHNINLQDKYVSKVSSRSPVTHSDLISKFEQGMVNVKAKERVLGVNLIKRDNVKVIARAHDDQIFTKQRAKSPGTNVIPKRGFESIRNNWEGKSSDQNESIINRSNESNAPVHSQRNTHPKNLQNTPSEFSSNRITHRRTDSSNLRQDSEICDLKHSQTFSSRHDDSISGTKTDSGQSDLEKTFSDSSETQPRNMSESSVGPPETLSSLSDVLSASDSEESGGQFSDAEDVFRVSKLHSLPVDNPSEKPLIVSTTEDRLVSKDVLTKVGNGTVRAKVAKVVPEISSPKSPSHTQTFRAKRCATYVEKVVNSDNSSSPQEKSKPATRRHGKREEKGNLHSTPVMNSSVARKLQFTGTVSQNSSYTHSPGGRNNSPSSPVEKRSLMRPKFKKSPSVPEGQDMQKKPLVSKNSAPNLTKTRKTSSTTKLNTSFDEGQKQRNSDRRSGVEKSPREKNVPSVFERLHANQPVRKTPVAKDLKENSEQPKLKKTVSRSSLRKSGNSSSLKPKSECLDNDEKDNVLTPTAMQDSQNIDTGLKSSQNGEDDSAFSEPQDEDMANAEPQCQNGHCSSGTEKKLNNGSGEQNVENKNHKNSVVPLSKNGDERIETIARPSPKPRKRNLVKIKNDAKSIETNISTKNVESNQEICTPESPPTESNSNFTRTEQRRSRRKMLRESESAQNNTLQNKPVQSTVDTERVEKLNESKVTSGGRSRSTNGSIASTSSSTDLPKGGRSGQDGQKLNLGLQQKVINIEFESKAALNGVDADHQKPETESITSLPKEKQIAPEFIIKPRRQLADEGEGAKFKASFEGCPEPKLTWQINGKDLENNDKYKIYQKDDFHFLEIASVLPEDAGKYTCLIQNEAGKASLSANLEVFAALKSTKSKSSPPVIEVELKDVVAKEGDRNVGLECKVKATTDSEVTWYFNGFVIKSGRDYRTGFDGTVAKLHFYDMKAEYDGAYECVVKTASGKAKSSCKLTIKSAQEVSTAPKFTQQLKSLTLQDGERLIFHAVVTGSPEPTVRWFRNKKELQATEDVLISFDGTNAKLQIEDVLPEDSAEFTCRAQNEAGEATTKATLTVKANENTSQTTVRKEPPRFLRELKNIEVKDGDRVEMVVEVEGTQPIEVIWVLNDKEIPLNSKEFAQIKDGQVHKLIIDEVFPEDSGKYSCEVFNDYGDIESACILNVRDTAEVQGPPQFIIKPASVQIEEGQAVGFTCQVSGNPVPSVDWEINGKAVVPGRRVRVSQNGDEYRLDIPHCVCGDSGRYTCVVTNKNGTVTHTASLNVTPSENTDSQEQTDFRSLLKSRPGLASIGSQDSTESIQSIQSEKSDKGEVEQHDFRKALTRQVETKQRPKFRSLLQDQKIKEGGEVTLQCEVKGVPIPEVSWSVNGKPIKESKYFRILHEDKLATLVIAEAYPEDEGQYMCTAENVAGSASCACDLYIEASSTNGDNKLSTSKSGESEAPRILEFEPTTISVKKGTSVKIRSRVSGEPEPKIMWFHNKSSVKQDDHIKIEKRRDVSTLCISNILPSDGGKYILVIENSVGSLDAVASVSVEDVPNPPAGKPHVSAVTISSIILAWYGPAYDGGSHITNYRVEICKAKDQIWKTLTSACKNTSYEATNLLPDTEYQFRVSAGNKHGLSDAGQVSDPVLTTDNYKSEPESDGYISSPTLARLERDELPFEPRDVKISSDRTFEEEFDMKEELGKGKFGNVHRCIQKNSGLSWAAKIIKCREKDKPSIRQEIEVMNSLRHPKLLMLWDAFECPKTMVLVMEYIAGGELFERIIDDEFVLTERDCVHFMRQICDGVCYMHDHNILHLDLKPENILCISPNSNLIKIIDFGLARPYHPGESTKVMLGTPEFIAPEVINYDEIGFTTDMWSLGVLCYVLLSGLSPFLGDSDPETLVNVTVGEIDFDDDAFADISLDAKEFIEKLVVKNKEKRMTVHQCLKHKWLAQDVKRLRLKRLNTRNLKQFLARRKWQVDQMLSNFRRLREDLDDDSDTELETKRRPLISAHSKDSGIDSYKDRDTYSSLTDYSAGGGTLEFLEEIADIEAMVGDVALFKVCVTGRPEPTIEWSHCNSQITPSRRFIMDFNEGGEYSLKIKNITEKDGGEYRCTAASSAGHVSCAANLTVLSL